MREAERRRIVEMTTKAQVNLARIRELMDVVEHDIHTLSNELKSLEMPEQD